MKTSDYNISDCSLCLGDGYYSGNAQDYLNGTVPICYICRINLGLAESHKEYAKEINWTLSLLYKFFKEDDSKVLLWLSSPIPFLGGMPPNYMIKSGRIRKLLSFIQTSLEENNRY